MPVIPIKIKHLSTWDQTLYPIIKVAYLPVHLPPLFTALLVSPFLLRLFLIVFSCDPQPLPWPLKKLLAL